jgi:MoaA/NifB/PqqE/SkfB family radical SAM enzyme
VCSLYTCFSLNNKTSVMSFVHCYTIPMPAMLISISPDDRCPCLPSPFDKSIMTAYHLSLPCRLLWLVQPSHLRSCRTCWWTHPCLSTSYPCCAA